MILKVILGLLRFPAKLVILGCFNFPHFLFKSELKNRFVCEHSSV